MNQSYHYFDEDTLNLLFNTQVKNLQHLEMQLSQHGELNSPVYLMNQVNAVREAIKDIETELKKRNSQSLKKERNDWFYESSSKSNIVGLRFLDAESSFKDRVDKTATINKLLKSKDSKVICIIGRGGIGKTMLVSRICVDFENEIENSDYSNFHGIIYLSCRGARKISIDELIYSVCKIMGFFGVDYDAIDNIVSYEEKIEILVKMLRGKRVLLVLDNAEDIINDQGRIRDHDINMFIEIFALKSNCMKVMLTSKEKIYFHDNILKFCRNIFLDDGIPEQDAIELLADLDHDDALGLGNYPIDIVKQIISRCYGIPRALESIAGLLNSDPELTIYTILSNDKIFNEKVVDNLVKENINNINEEEKLILEMISVYNKPIPLSAVVYIFNELGISIDVGYHIKSLLRKYMVIHKRYVDLYYLHPIDQKYIYESISLRKSYSLEYIHLVASGFYGSLRKNTKDIHNIDDLQPQKDQIEQLLMAHKYEDVYEVINSIDEYLTSWGRYVELYNMRNTIVPHLSGNKLAFNKIAVAECLYQGLDKWNEALQFVEEVENLFDEHKDELALAEAIQIHSHILFDKGLFDDAFDKIEGNVKRFSELGLDYELANTYNSLGIFLDALGKWDEAIEYYRKSINIFNDTAITYELGRIMINQSVSEFMVYGPDKAIASCLQGVQFCSKDIRPQEYAYGMLNLCVFYLAKNDIVNARKILEQCDEWSIKERWYWLNLQQVKANLLRFEGKCNDALLLLENLVDEFNDLDDNWGEIDVIINRSCILIDMKSDEKIYLELIHKAFMLSQQRKYYLGMRINAYLLLKEEDISNLDQDIIELGNEFKKNHLHLFEGDIFVPCYVLLLRAKSILY